MVDVTGDYPNPVDVVRWAVSATERMIKTAADPRFEMRCREGATSAASPAVKEALQALRQTFSGIDADLGAYTAALRELRPLAGRPVGAWRAVRPLGASAAAWDGTGSREVLVFADPAPSRDDLELLVASLLPEGERPEGKAATVQVEGVLLFTFVSIRSAWTAAAALHKCVAVRERSHCKEYVALSAAQLPGGGAAAATPREIPGGAGTEEADERESELEFRLAWNRYRYDRQDEGERLVEYLERVSGYDSGATRQGVGRSVLPPLRREPRKVLPRLLRAVAQALEAAQANRDLSGLLMQRRTLSRNPEGDGDRRAFLPPDVLARLDMVEESTSSSVSGSGPRFS